MSGVLFWVRNRIAHTAAHVVARWDQRRAAFMCGEEAAPGGKVITYAEARKLQVHVCVGCTRKVRGGRR